jgi:DNA-binding response OmpR family regulator
VLDADGRTAVLFVSGYADETIIRGDDLGPRKGYLQKPFTPDALVGKVHALLGGLAS